MKTEGIFDASLTKTLVKKLQKAEQEQDKIICALFLNAVNNYDGQQILEIANTVWKLRGYGLRGFDAEKPRQKSAKRAVKDLRRAKLLALKGFVLSVGEKMTPRQVAVLLGFNREQIEDMAVAGFSFIKEMCHAVDFPLVESASRKIRKK